ncbi:MAG: ATP-dependent RecD-like DNA helicase [Bacillota bacterium]|nr:ATP-dependent RecD-like DNA helicase [Bacillota bacterium]
MEEIKKGVIAEIIYHNQENGYTIAVVENQEEQEQFTAVGHLPSAARGRLFSFTGRWKTHPSYGEQFAFSSYEEELPGTAEDMETFLASGLLKGIGKKTAAAIVARFGQDTLKVIEEEPERLTEVPGIGAVKAASVAESFQAHRELASITLYLQQFGVSAGYAVKLYKAYGADTIQIIEEDPYRLIDDVFGIGFRKADQIAEKLGVPRDAPQRLRSAALFALWYYVGEGHTFVPRTELCEKTAELLEQSSSQVEEILAEMAFRGEVCMENLEGRPVVFLPPYYWAEQRCCAKLLSLEKAAMKPVSSDLDALLRAAEGRGGARLSENQKDAVKASLAHGVSVITGGPGTGKTTIITAILHILEHSGQKAVIAAPTGRAAKRIAETTGYAASTIHRLLEYSFSEDESELRFGKNEESPLECDAVIIDEASMIDILLMNGLLSAISPGTRLILVGDADQLPSVGPGNVLRDIIASEVIHSVKLTEIFRQARESLIVVNAHKINRGECPDWNQKDKDFFFLRRKGEKEMLLTIKDLCTRRLPGFQGDKDPIRDVQVLTPVRKGLLGCINLNQELQAVLNPPSESRRERRFGERIFREGDKVMQIRNNYELEWKRLDDFTDGRGVFNGDVGLVEAIDPEFNEMTVVYDDCKYVKYEFAQLDELELAYAVTVHKSQGSEFPVMVMPVSWFPPMLATRNLFYTAVTRARELVVLVGSPDKMQAMIDNNRTVERYSGLRERLRRTLEAWE